MNDLAILEEDEPAASTHGSADDPDGRAVMVRTITMLCTRVREKHGIRLFLADRTHPLDDPASLRGPELWELAEYLCMLIVLDEADQVDGVIISGLRGPVPHPIRFTRDGQRRCLWIQHRMLGKQSGFRWQPDLVVTEEADVPSSDNVLEIIECKCIRKLNSKTIRSEYAKGVDLEAPAYLIWSYFEVSQHVRNGTQGLGLHLRTIGLAGPERSTLLDEDALVRRVSEGMRTTRETRPLAAALARRAAAVTEKADRDRDHRIR